MSYYSCGILEIGPVLHNFFGKSKIFISLVNIGFLSIGAIDILGWMIIVSGAVVCIVGHLNASLASAPGASSSFL